MVIINSFLMNAFLKIFFEIYYNKISLDLWKKKCGALLLRGPFGERNFERRGDVAVNILLCLTTFQLFWGETLQYNSPTEAGESLFSQGIWQSEVGAYSK